MFKATIPPYSAATHLIRMDTNISMAAAAPQENTWMCQICTYKNTVNSVTCDACSLPKGATPLLSEQSQSSNLRKNSLRKDKSKNNRFAEETKFSEDIEDSFIDRKPRALLPPASASRSSSKDDCSMDRKPRARPSPRFDTVNRQTSNLSIAKKSVDDDVSEYDELSTVKSEGPFETGRGKLNSAAKSIIDDNSFDFSAQAKKPITKKEVAEKNQKICAASRILSQEQERELTLSDQKLQLDELDDEIRAIESELTRLGDRQMNLVERRMMIQTKINFLEQEQLDAQRHFKENCSSYMY